MSRAIKNNETQAGISILRILATVGIICLHTCSTITDNPELFTLTEAQTHFFNAGQLIWRWAVPVFFMITGALLLRPDKKIDYRICVGKYCKRILLALIIFSFPYAGLIQYSNGIRGAALVWNSVIAIFTGNSFSHLWYLYSLLGIYLTLPILKAFTEKCEKREIACACIAMFIFLL